MDPFQPLKSRMTPAEITAVEDFVFGLIDGSSRTKLMRYLTYINKDTQLKLIDSFGFEVECKVVRPKWFDNPPRLTEQMYPLNDAKTMFAAERPYDYMATFRVSDLDAFDKDTIFYKTISDLLQMQSQTRFTNIWRALASVLYALDSILLRQDHIVRKYVAMFLEGNDDTPFFQNQQGFVFTNKHTISIIPYMIYMLISVGTDIVVGNILEGDAVRIIEFYTNMARESYCDRKLKIKSKIRSWLTEGLHLLGECEVIEWSPDCQPIGLYMKDLKESGFVLEQIVAARLERKEFLDPDMFEYIEERLRKIKTIKDVEALFRITHSMSNDRSYYKTLVELSLKAAVGPKINETLVPAPTVLLLDSNGGKIDFTFEGRSEHLLMCEQYLRDAARKIAPTVEATDFIQQWLMFLTTASAGGKLPEEKQTKLTKFEKLSQNIRIVRVAIEADKFYTMEMFLESIKDSVTLVVRQQIDRRQRAIAGLSNAKLAASFLSYIIGKNFYKLSPSVAQGKQIGNMLDAKMLMHSTTQPLGLTSSVDISGMDASIQPTLRPVYDTLVFNASRRPVNSPFGVFTDRYEEVTEQKVENGEVVGKRTYRTKLSAATQVLSFQANNMQTSTIYKSKLFGTIPNGEGTFESGRTDTSTHHTVLLDAAMNSSARMYRQLGNPDVRMMHQEMGDDLCLLYSGRPEYCLNQAEFDAEFLSYLGFKTTLDVSRNQGIFLQQQVCVGRIFGLSNRVSLFTREHEKTPSSLASAAAELRAVMDDMSSRIPDPVGLRILVWAIGLICISKHSLNIHLSKYDSIVSSLKKYIRVQEYPVNAIHQKRFNTRLITIYAPMVWLFMYKGGELPAPGLLKDDGTYTSPQYITSPSGHYKRRLMIEIVGISKVSTSDLIDSELLRSYRFHAAQMLIDLNLLGLERKARVDDETEIDIEKLGSKLNALGNQSKINKSLAATKYLADKGIKLDDSILYHRANITKIKQIAESGEVTDVNEEKFTQYLDENIAKLLGSKRDRTPIIKLTKDDIYHLYTIEKLDIPVNITRAGVLAYHCPLLFSMKGANEMWALYALIGGPSAYEGKLKKEIASLRGRFSFFRYSDPIFVSAIDVYRNHRQALPDFFDAVGIAESARPNFMKAIEYYNQFSHFKYDYALSPRRIFILTDNVSGVEDTCFVLPRKFNLSGSVANARLYQTLMMTYAYLYLLTDIEDYIDNMSKFTINLDARLIKLLRLQS